MKVTTELLEKLYERAPRITMAKNGFNRRTDIELQGTGRGRMATFSGQGVTLEDVLLSCEEQIGCFLNPPEHMRGR